MKGWLLVAVGLVLALIGLVWTFQGLGLLTGSPMTGQRLWFGIGLVAAIVGLVLLVVGARNVRKRSNT